MKQETFKSGAKRDRMVAGSKDSIHVARYDLITPVGLRRLAETYGEGAEKYGENNWKKGLPMSNVLNHALAHIVTYLSGDRTEDHLAHAAWGLFAAMHFEKSETVAPK